MYRAMRIALGLAVVVALTGCAGSVGPTQTETINVPKPADLTQPWEVQLDLGVASVEVDSHGESLVQGVIEYNVPELKPIVTAEDLRVHIRQEFNGVLPINSRNDWRLQLGRGVPLHLIVNTGASSGEWELGGLSLRQLNWTQGAAGATLKFSEPNPERLEHFTINGGAASLTARGLANANIEVANFTAGAGAVTLYFDGQLSQPAEVILDGGVSSIAIYSGGNPIQLITEGALKAVENTGWTQADNTYTSPEWGNASGPTITIRARIGVAALKLIAGM
ncbi:MAG TPA: toast rack family protein [Anaerolineae bacterium]|nr:toast rack family protein [Anaerolineae bacterium]